MQFLYKAKNKEGEIREGEMEAKDRLDLLRRLRDEGFFALEVRAKDGEGAGLKRFNNIEIGILFEKIMGVPLDEKMMFSRNASVMLESGIPLLRAIEVLEHQTQSPTLKNVLKDVSKEIKRGTSFSDAVGKYPRVFGKLYSSMIKVGETAGNLDETLNLLANQLEKQHELRARVKGALIYPSVIITAMVGIGVLLMVTVIPQLKSVFEELGVELPITTRFIVGLSDFLVAFWWLLLAILPFAIFGIRKTLSTKSGKRSLDWTLLRMPIFKNIVRKVNNANFSRTLSSLVSGGVPILEGLEITADTVGNTYYKESILDARKKVKKGDSLHETLAGYPKLYTPLMLEMIEVGEEAGKLSELLGRVAEFYEGEVSDITANLSSIIEPVLMLIIGAGVGFFAVSVMQPIYGMIGSI
ncbi:MAG: type II secretion system F family protein [Candidatus Spechtbacterales bacterium]